LAGLRFIGVPEEHVHMGMRIASSGSVGIPSDVVPVGLVAGIKERPGFAQKRECGFYLGGGQVKDRQTVCPREDDAASAQQVSFKVFGVHKHTQVVLERKTTAFDE
jgi:hypothetical protein